MIELTPQQWQAIAQEEHPTLIEPESGLAYVLVLKEEYEIRQRLEAEVAGVLRITWMRRMRLDEEEIVEALRDEPPISIEAEMTQWRALDRLDQSPLSIEILRAMAVKY